MIKVTLGIWCNFHLRCQYIDFENMVYVEYGTVAQLQSSVLFFLSIIYSIYILRLGIGNHEHENLNC